MFGKAQKHKKLRKPKSGPKMHTQNKPANSGKRDNGCLSASSQPESTGGLSASKNPRLENFLGVRVVLSQGWPFHAVGKQVEICRQVLCPTRWDLKTSRRCGCRRAVAVSFAGHLRTGARSCVCYKVSLSVFLARYHQVQEVHFWGLRTRIISEETHWKILERHTTRHWHTHTSKWVTHRSQTQIRNHKQADDSGWSLTLMTVSYCLFPFWKTPLSRVSTTFYDILAQWRKRL